MTRERIVIDTNVLISGLFSTTSTPARAVERAVQTGQLVGTVATLRELAGKLLSPRLDRYVPREQRDALLVHLAPLVEIVEVLQPIRASRDSHDDMFLEAAVNGRADVIVTGDRDLLVLNPFRGVRIVTPSAFVTRRP